jgi:hypothetical protein
VANALPDPERLGQRIGFPEHLGERESQPFRKRLTLSQPLAPRPP